MSNSLISAFKALNSTNWYSFEQRTVNTPYGAIDYIILPAGTALYRTEKEALREQKRRLASALVPVAAAAAPIARIPPKGVYFSSPHGAAQYVTEATSTILEYTLVPLVPKKIGVNVVVAPPSPPTYTCLNLGSQNTRNTIYNFLAAEKQRTTAAAPHNATAEEQIKAASNPLLYSDLIFLLYGDTARVSKYSIQRRLHDIRLIQRAYEVYREAASGIPFSPASAETAAALLQYPELKSLTDTLYRKGARATVSDYREMVVHPAAADVMEEIQRLEVARHRAYVEKMAAYTGYTPAARQFLGLPAIEAGAASSPSAPHKETEEYMNALNAAANANAEASILLSRISLLELDRLFVEQLAIVCDFLNTRLERNTAATEQFIGAYAPTIPMLYYEPTQPAYTDNFHEEFFVPADEYKQLFTRTAAVAVNTTNVVLEDNLRVIEAWPPKDAVFSGRRLFLQEGADVAFAQWAADHDSHLRYSAAAPAYWQVVAQLVGQMHFTFSDAYSVVFSHLLDKDTAPLAPYVRKAYELGKYELFYAMTALFAQAMVTPYPYREEEVGPSAATVAAAAAVGSAEAGVTKRITRARRVKTPLSGGPGSPAALLLGSPPPMSPVTTPGKRRAENSTAVQPARNPAIINLTGSNDTGGVPPTAPTAPAPPASFGVPAGPSPILTPAAAPAGKLPYTIDVLVFSALSSLLRTSNAGLNALLVHLREIYEPLADSLFLPPPRSNNAAAATAAATAATAAAPPAPILALIHDQQAQAALPQSPPPPDPATVPLDHWRYESILSGGILFSIYGAFETRRLTKDIDAKIISYNPEEQYNYSVGSLRLYDIAARKNNVLALWVYLWGNLNQYLLTIYGRYLAVLFFTFIRRAGIIQAADYVALFDKAKHLFFDYQYAANREKNPEPFISGFASYVRPDVDKNAFIYAYDHFLAEHPIAIPPYPTTNVYFPPTVRSIGDVNTVRQQIRAMNYRAHLAEAHKAKKRGKTAATAPQPLTEKEMEWKKAAAEALNAGLAAYVTGLATERPEYAYAYQLFFALHRKYYDPTAVQPFGEMETSGAEIRRMFRFGFFSSLFFSVGPQTEANPLYGIFDYTFDYPSALLHTFTFPSGLQRYGVYVHRETAYASFLYFLKESAKLFDICSKEYYGDKMPDGKPKETNPFNRCSPALANRQKKLEKYTERLRRVGRILRDFFDDFPLTGALTDTTEAYPMKNIPTPTDAGLALLIQYFLREIEYVLPVAAGGDRAALLRERSRTVSFFVAVVQHMRRRGRPVSTNMYHYYDVARNQLTDVGVKMLTVAEPAEFRGTAEGARERNLYIGEGGRRARRKGARKTRRKHGATK